MLYASIWIVLTQTCWRRFYKDKKESVTVLKLSSSLQVGLLGPSYWPTGFYSVSRTTQDGEDRIASTEIPFIMSFSIVLPFVAKKSL
jgi:hypothetical protein